MFDFVSSKMPLSRQAEALKFLTGYITVAKARRRAGLRLLTFRHSEGIMNKSFGVLTLCFN